ncbi:hypothetical protein IWQ61_000423 [Dispira simplex]|nr:hypothetical protein IWQ61_000423 [Dispira simplex]
MVKQQYWLTALFAVAFLTLIPFSHSETIQGKECTTYHDCTAYHHHKGPGSSERDRLGEYSCLDGTCHYVVQAGESCARATDCGGYQFALLTNPNETLARPESDFCSPDYCTLESTCDGAWTLSGAPSLGSDTTGCCAGLPAKASCGFFSDVVDPCSYHDRCDVDDITRVSNLARVFSGLGRPTRANDNSVSYTQIGTCENEDTKRYVWIGIVLVLLGGTIQNIGLNMQKYGHRQSLVAEEASAVELEDHEKDFKSHESQEESRSNITTTGLGDPSDQAVPTKVAATRENFSSGQSSITSQSFASARQHSELWPNSLDSNSGGLKSGIDSEPSTLHALSDTAKQPDSVPDQTATGHPSESPLKRPPSLAASIRSQRTVAAPSLTRTQRILAKVSFWKNIPFRNPVWLIGLVVFIVGNVMNFVALQFAPQSLVAPLGAVALVTNVIIAPILNKERITAWDFGGIFLICGGSVIVVVFSGIVQANYRLCVLMSLLQRPPTIAYLTVIGAALVADYIFLRHSEKRLQGQRGLGLMQTSAWKKHVWRPLKDRWWHIRGLFCSRMQPVGVSSTTLFAHMESPSQRTTKSQPVGELVHTPVSAHILASTPRDHSLSSDGHSMYSRDTRRNTLVDSSTIPPWVSSTWSGGKAISPADSRRLTGIRWDTPELPQAATLPRRKEIRSPAMVSPVDISRLESNVAALHPSSPLLPPPPIPLASTLDETPRPSAETQHSTGQPSVPPSNKLNVASVSPETKPNPVDAPGKKQKRIESYLLPFLYAAMGALMASLTTLFAKSLINLITVSFTTGENQFTSFVAWLILFVTVFTAVSQVYWINMGLRRYDALLQVPVFYVIWTVMDIIGGGIYYDEFRLFDALKYCMFVLGVLVIFSGIGCLARRLKQIETTK